MVRNCSMWVVLLLIVVITVICVYSMRPGLPWSGDFSMYLMQKDALGKGGEADLLAMSTFRSENSTKIVGPAVYPWGYPVALFIMSKLVADDIELFKLANAVLMGLFLLLVYSYFKGSVGSFSMVVMVAVIGLSPGFYEVKSSVLSDMLAVTLSFFSLLLMRLFVGSPSARKYIYAVVCGVFMFAAYITRTQYVVLPFMAIAVVLDDFESHRDNGGRLVLSRLFWMNHILPFAVFLVLAAFSYFSFSAQSSYKDHFVGFDVLGVLLGNVLYYSYALSLVWGIVNIDPDLFKVQGALRVFVSGLMFTIFLPAFLYGALCGLRKYRVSLFIAALGMVVPVLYPYQGGLRLILFVVPFYVWLVLLGVEHLSALRWWSIYARLSRVVIVFVVLFSIACAMYKISLYSQDDYVLKDGPLSPASVEVWEYIKSNTDKSATFAFWDPRVLNFFTGRKAASYRSLSEIDSSLIDYVVMSRDGDVLSCATCRECYDDQERVFSNGNFVVCKTKPSR